MTYLIWQHSAPNAPFSLTYIGTVEADSPQDALDAAKANGISAPIIGPYEGAIQ